MVGSGVGGGRESITVQAGYAANNVQYFKVHMNKDGSLNKSVHLRERET